MLKVKCSTRAMNSRAVVTKNSLCVSKYTYFIINLLKCLNNPLKMLPYFLLTVEAVTQVSHTAVD